MNKNFKLNTDLVEGIRPKTEDFQPRDFESDTNNDPRRKRESDPKEKEVIVKEEHIMRVRSHVIEEIVVLGDKQKPGQNPSNASNAGSNSKNSNNAPGAHVIKRNTSKTTIVKVDKKEEEGDKGQKVSKTVVTTTVVTRTSKPVAKDLITRLNGQATSQNTNPNSNTDPAHNQADLKDFNENQINDSQNHKINIKKFLNAGGDNIFGTDEETAPKSNQNERDIQSGKDKSKTEEMGIDY